MPSVASRLLNRNGFLRGKCQGSGGRGPKNAAADAVHQRYGIEVDQKSDPALTQSKVRQQSRFMQWTELFDCLEFRNDFATHDDIRQIVRVDLVVPDRQANLLAERDPGL